MDNIFTSDDNIIKLKSTSYNTADVTPIVLNETAQIRTSFLPCLIDNQKDVSCCVSGKLVHERKSLKECEFPSTKISKKDVKSGDILEIALSTSETKLLVEGLNNLFQLHSEIGYVPSGNVHFTRINTTILQSIKQLGNLTNKYTSIDIIECIDFLSSVLLENDNVDNVSEVLKNYADLDKFANLNDIINISKLNNCLKYIEGSIGNDSEAFWQEFLTNNQWIISQLFLYPSTIYKGKAYVGGKSINNVDGHIVDYLIKNDRTKNVALVEIKTPETKLLGKAYRNGVYALSSELSGGINQVLQYKDSLQKEWTSLSKNEAVLNFNPECLLIIGNTLELSDEVQIGNFELLRSSLVGVKIITFDEIIAKTRSLIDLLCIK